ncbi:MAG: hypothetical protein ACRDWA_00395 [Acidimicrobiia bacterium]
MAARVFDPTGREWKVFLGVLRTRRPWRWRGPRWLFRFLDAADLAEMGEIPLIGVVLGAIGVAILVLFLLVLLPFLALAVLEASWSPWP